MFGGMGQTRTLLLCCQPLGNVYQVPNEKQRMRKTPLEPPGHQRVGTLGVSLIMACVASCFAHQCARTSTHPAACYCLCAFWLAHCDVGGKNNTQPISNIVDKRIELQRLPVGLRRGSCPQAQGQSWINAPAQNAPALL
jgi:hypothetical protein